MSRISDRLEHLFTLSSALLCIAGTDGYFKRVNPAFPKTLGHTEAELLSRPFIDFVHPDDREATLNELHKLSMGIPTVLFENRYRHANGSYCWVLWNTTSVAEEGLLYASAIDITNRKQAEFELIEKQRKLEILAARLVLGEENERRRIARGLHDDVGQTLAAAKLTLDELLESDLPEDRDSSAQALRGLLDQAIHTTRILTFDLASAALYEIGLGAALQSACERAEKDSGIWFQPLGGEEGSSIPDETKVLLYRIARELVRNVVKHSKAQTAKVALTVSSTRIVLTVEDDGQGFEAPLVLDNPDLTVSFGLFSIIQQLDPLGGGLEIASSPESGTRVVVTVPFHVKGEC